MSENCTHDCSTCSSACASRTAPQDLLEKPNDMTHVKKLSVPPGFFGEAQ